jgi:SAM-dependent methyltransferase
MSLTDLFQLIRTVRPAGISKIKTVHHDMITYARGYIVPHVLSVFLNTGIMEDIKAERGIDVEEYAARRGFNPEVFAPLCNYLYSVGLLNKDGAKLVLSEEGERLADLSVGVFDFLHAYSPIFQNLEPLLKNEKVYGRDLDRHTDYVAKASTEITRYLPFPAAKRLLEKHRYRRVLDLGCGNGAFLFYVTSVIDNGIGVDLAREAIASAQRRAAEAGLQGRLQFRVGDIFELEKLAGDASRPIEMISLMFVLHEFLYRGEERALALLRGIHRAFPRSDLLVCELSECSPEELRRKKTAICEHHLFHRLSLQGYATTEQWRKIFAQSGYRVKDEVSYGFAEQGYFVLQPS